MAAFACYEYRGTIRAGRASHWTEGASGVDVETDITGATDIYLLSQRYHEV